MLGFEDDGLGQQNGFEIVANGTIGFASCWEEISVVVGICCLVLRSLLLRQSVG